MNERFSKDVVVDALIRCDPSSNERVFLGEHGAALFDHWRTICHEIAYKLTPGQSERFLRSVGL